MSKKEAPRGGILAALWIPTDENGNLMKDALKTNIEFLRKTGIYGILALGSTGEFARMTLPRRQEVLETVAELAPDLPLVANLTSIRLDEVISLGKTAMELGYAGAAIMAPSFYPINQDDMLEFFLRAAEKVDLPFLLYNFPELVANRIGIETVRGFAERANMFGIKQSGGEFEYHKDLIALGNEKNYSVFSGADCRLPEVFGLGAKGCIGGLTNIVPDIMIEIYRIMHEGKQGDLEKAGRRMSEIGKICCKIPFPLEVMSGMEAKGFQTGAPKQVVSDKTKAFYKQIVGEYKALFDKWAQEDAAA